MSFPRYPAYKDSGVEWLGEVPEHWDVKPLKRLADIQTGLAKGNELEPENSVEVPFLRVANVQDGFLDLDDIHTIKIPKMALDRYLLRADDVLMNEGGDFDKLGRGCIWNGEINPCIHQNHVFAVRPNSVSSAWLNTYTSSPQANSFFIGRSKQSTNLASISSSNLMDLPVPIAPAAEADDILCFLDHETAKIDALIAEQQRLIELLQEKRQAVISHAVTKGLNPDAAMKDSGVDWLGEVPEHWIITALKRVVSVCGRIGYRGYTTDDLVPEGEGALVLGATNLTSTGKLDLTKKTFLSWHKYEESPEIMVFINDLVIGQRGTCGKVVIIDHEIGPATINPSLVLLRRACVDSEFLCYWLMGGIVQCIFNSFLTSTAVPMLSQQQIGNVPVIHPPLDEQRAIVSYITVETHQLDTLTAVANRAVVLFQERRSALISAAVTGQIDVRGLVPVEAAA